MMTPLHVDQAEEERQFLRRQAYCLMPAHAPEIEIYTAQSHMTFKLVIQLIHVIGFIARCILKQSRRLLEWSIRTTSHDFSTMTY